MVEFGLYGGHALQVDIGASFQLRDALRARSCSSFIRSARDTGRADRRADLLAIGPSAVILSPSGSSLDFDGFINERGADDVGTSHDLHHIFLQSDRVV